MTSSFSVYNTSVNCPVVPSTTPIKNFKTLEEYLQKVYHIGDPPLLRDMTFLWSHLIGDLDNWAKNGLVGVKPTFRWNNQPLPSPKVPYFTSTTTSLLTNAAFSQDLINAEQVDAIIETLPRDNQLWTPDWFTYPQMAINRWNPRAWNQYYYKWNTLNNNVSGTSDGSGGLTPDSVKVTKCILTDLSLEGSNTGGPDGGQTFFYLATGGGMTFKATKAGIAFNKMHAYYMGECYKANGGTDPIFGGSGATLTNANKVLAIGNMLTALSGTPLLAQMEIALTNESGYWSFPSTLESPAPTPPQTSGKYVSLNQLLWGNAPTTVANQIETDFPYPTSVPGGWPAISTDVSRLFAVICYLIGVKAGQANPSSNLPSPALPNGDCPASNCCPGSVAAPFSNFATKPYEYLVQVATNLTVVDNILDSYVKQAMVDMGNLDAMLNLCQWNALGGWTCEIPTNAPTGKPSGEVIVPANGGVLTTQWWSGIGGILGINDYTQSNSNFEISNEYLLE